MCAHDSQYVRYENNWVSFQTWDFHKKKSEDLILSTIVDINGFLLQREINFSYGFPQELQIHSEVAKDVINAEVIGQKARKTWNN